MVVPMILPVCRSCTVQPRLEKCKSRPSSHNYPTDIRFRDNLGTKKILGNVKEDVEIVPILSIVKVELSSVWIVGAIEGCDLEVNGDELEVIWCKRQNKNTMKRKYLEW